MDEGADRIAEDLKDIAQTRMAIAEKLGAIEQHVGTTMHHARTMMTQVVDKTTLSVNETMQATKEAFDLRIQAARHPWIFVGGAVVLGYGISALYQRGWRITSGVVPYYPRGAKAAPVMPKSGAASSREEEPEVYPFYPPSHEAGEVGGVQDHAKGPTVLGELEKALYDELGVVRNSIVRFGRDLIHEMVRQTVPALIQVIAGSRHERNHRSGGDPPHY
jgi:hypothetical protein